MKKTLKRVLAIWLAAVLLLLSSCRMNGNTKVPDGTTASADESTATIGTTASTDESTEADGEFGITENKSADALAEQDHTIEAKNFPHYRGWGNKNASSPDGEMTLYFVDGKDIPYVELSEYLLFLSSVLKFTRKQEIRFEVQPPKDDCFFVFRSDSQCLMYIDPAEDRIVFTDFNQFLQSPDSNALVTVMNLPDLSANEDDHSFIMTSNDVFNRGGDPITIKLRDYFIDIIGSDGKCYLPMQTMNDLFLNTEQILYVFNGKAVIGDVFHGDLINKMYEADPREMSSEFALFNYNELCFLLDYFYGLKAEHGISTFSDYLLFDFNYFNELTSTDSREFEQGLKKLLYSYFDDGHSFFVKNSWRSGKKEDNNDKDILPLLGYSSKSTMMMLNQLTTARDEAYPNGVPGYEEIGDTAFITFDSFSSARGDKSKYYGTDEPDPEKDSIELILYAHRRITREDSPIKNIVMDLSLNTGGSVDAAAVAASWFTGNAPFAIRDTMTGAETIVSYCADINLNRQTLMDSDDYVAGGKYNLYCLTSPLSFSSGNLLPAIFRNSHQVSLIGRCTGGGSCLVLPATTASGTVFTISGNRQLSTFKNGSFYSVDGGIEPDIPLTKASSYYDRDALTELIHSLR